MFVPSTSGGFKNIILLCFCYVTTTERVTGVTLSSSVLNSWSFSVYIPNGFNSAAQKFDPLRAERNEHGSFFA